MHNCKNCLHARVEMVRTVHCRRREDRKDIEFDAFMEGSDKVFHRQGECVEYNDMDKEESDAE